MTWFKVDDSFAQHPKVLSIPRRDRAAAIGLWTLAGTWCAQQLTDGHLAKHMVEEFGCTTRLAEQLVRAGLWRASAEAYSFHDWEAWQPTRDQVEAERSAARDRMRRARSSRRSGGSSPEQPPNNDGTSGAVRVTPTRPDPTRSSSTEEQEKPGPRKRGTRIPDDFTPSEALIRFAAEQGFDIGQAATITAEFIDYWRGVAGAKGVKLDWDGTWRNWIRRQDPAKVRATNVHPINGSTFTNSDLDRILGPAPAIPQPPSHLTAEEMWEWDQRTRREMRAARVQQANAKLGRSA